MFYGFSQIYLCQIEKTTRGPHNTAGMQQGIALKLPEKNCKKIFVLFGLMKI